MRSLLLTILLTACTTSTKTEEGDGSPDHGDGTDLSCQIDSDCAAYEICEAEACVTGDHSNGFTETEDISVSTSDEDNSVTGHINTPGDIDYWRYVSAGGEFIQVSIDKHEIAEDHPEDEPKPDLFITLYDQDRNVVTSADNYANGGSVSDADSVIYAYLSRAGDYVIVVEDVYARNGEEGLSGPEYTYRLEVSRRVGTDGLESSIEEPIRLDGSGSTGIQMASTSWRTVGVLIDEPGEVDYIAVLFDNENLDPLIDKDPEGNPYTWTNGLLRVAGVEDLTGSDATPMVTLLSPEDVEVAHSENIGPANTMKYPAITTGQWIIAATDADGGGGPNHWFYLLLNADNEGDNIPWEVEENGMASVATPIPTTDTTNPSGKAFSQGAIQGFVNEAGDNDWFSMSAPADNAGDIDGEPAQWVVVCANSHLWGAASSPRITVYDASGSVLGESETDPDGNPNVEIKNLVIEPGETINVQVNHGAESTGAADEWYRMKVFIASFEVGSYTCP
jgi:hypothetical protein